MPPATYTTGGPSGQSVATVMAVMNGAVQSWILWEMSEDLASSRLTVAPAFVVTLTVGVFAYTWYMLYAGPLRRL